MGKVESKEVIAWRAIKQVHSASYISTDTFASRARYEISTGSSTVPQAGLVQ